ncbi:LysR substrate-binding domain-containing protein [Rhizobium sp. BK251]|uniref:LysR substrate-binding domain-containing protein n=1 Tax=Rhizobium sp. BK251 TaxID=2512125 RepID=UPI001044172A|nr:LysR substrate-binding domain-containing protein [Rhizobium sp. BK251]TCL65717.1 LysR family glycine cleavage system transcriptional activator [Rhizobium sp. BK251]
MTVMSLFDVRDGNTHSSNDVIADFARYKRLILAYMREENSHMTYRRLPPLNAVRAFVSAARHASFTLAAAELGVTHGAVSRQVKQLEQHLGVSLFTRGIRQIALTTSGRELFAGMAPAMERIATTAEAVARSAPTAGLRINVRASFAARWLIPQLPGFIREFPHISPQVTTSDALPERVVRDSFDVIIRRATTGWPVDLQPQAFLSDRSYLVASPSLLDAKPVQLVGDLSAHIFLHSETRGDDWREWLRFAGAANLVPVGELRFDHLDFALRAAADGLGVAVGPASLVAQDLASGRLCRVLPDMVKPIGAYQVALADVDNVSAMAFKQWLLDVSQLSSRRDL